MADFVLSLVQKRLLREFAFRPLDASHFCSGKRTVVLSPKIVQTHINTLVRAGVLEEIHGHHFQITRAGRDLLDNCEFVSAQSDSRYEAARNAVRTAFTGIEMICTRPGAGLKSPNGRPS